MRPRCNSAIEAPRSCFFQQRSIWAIDLLFVDGALFPTIRSRRVRLGGREALSVPLPGTAWPAPEF